MFCFLGGPIAAFRLFIFLGFFSLGRCHRRRDAIDKAPEAAKSGQDATLDVIDAAAKAIVVCPLYAPRNRCNVHFWQVICWGLPCQAKNRHLFKGSLVHACTLQSHYIRMGQLPRQKSWGETALNGACLLIACFLHCVVCLTVRSSGLWHPPQTAHHLKHVPREIPNLV